MTGSSGEEGAARREGDEDQHTAFRRWIEVLADKSCVPQTYLEFREPPCCPLPSGNGLPRPRVIQHYIARAHDDIIPLFLSGPVRSADDHRLQRVVGPHGAATLAVHRASSIVNANSCTGKQHTERLRREETLGSAGGRARPRVHLRARRLRRSSPEGIHGGKERVELPDTVRTADVRHLPGGSYKFDYRSTPVGRAAPSRKHGETRAHSRGRNALRRHAATRGTPRKLVFLGAERDFFIATFQQNSFLFPFPLCLLLWDASHESK